MDNRSDLIKLDDEDVYMILYLCKVKGYRPNELMQEFRISRKSLDDLLAGHVRKNCYKGFNQIEKYLVETR
ncbi:hypothetical protein [Planococcus dechangensis]|uniref:Uncharacterized protein n=1 Tax=Planococcus dechangensis TaxID=1176255 RepID=A0ABV9MEY4_9BACL